MTYPVKILTIRVTQSIFLLISPAILFSLVFYPQPAFAGPGGPGISEMSLPITDDLTVDPNLVRTYGSGDFILHVRSVLPYYTLLRFNTSDLPERSSITYAELNLYMQANYEAREDEWLTITAGMPTFYWREESYRPPSSSYLWGTYLTSSTVTDSDIERPITWDVTDIVKAWAGGEPNYGIILVPDAASPSIDGESADFRFESKEHAEVWGGHRPRLTVWYRSNSWFNWEVFQIFASIFNRPTPAPSPSYIQFPQISPTPTMSPVNSQPQIDSILSPTPTLSLYKQKDFLPSPTPTISLPQLQYQPQQYQAILPSPTPTPKVLLKPIATPTPKTIDKPTATPTAKVFTKPSPTPTSSKSIKGIQTKTNEKALSWFVGNLFQFGCNQSLVCSILYPYLTTIYNPLQ